MKTQQPQNRRQKKAPKTQTSSHFHSSRRTIRWPSEGLPTSCRMGTEVRHKGPSQPIVTVTLWLHMAAFYLEIWSHCNNLSEDHFGGIPLTKPLWSPQVLPKQISPCKGTWQMWLGTTVLGIPLYNGTSMNTTKWIQIDPLGLFPRLEQCATTNMHMYIYIYTLRIYCRMKTPAIAGLSTELFGDEKTTCGLESFGYKDLWSIAHFVCNLWNVQIFVPGASNGLP